MTAAAYQSALLRMLMDASFRAGVAAGAELDGPLDDVERRRLRAHATDAGVALSATLHRGWRLTKLLTLLPYTCAAAEPALLQREYVAFTATERPHGLYFVDEAVRFADHLVAACAESAPLVADVARFEQASLRLADAQRLGDDEPTVRVAMRHDPAELLTRLATGAPLDGVPERPTGLVGTVAGGRTSWAVEPG